MLKLAAKLRQETGKKNKHLRESGFIPVVLYGPGIKNVSLAVKMRDFIKIFEKAGESTLIELKIENGKEDNRIVLIYDVSRDPVNEQIVHADFYQVKMDQSITVEVPLVFIGQSEAVEKDKGVLIKGYQSIEIEALPKDLIHEIEVDISVLKTFEDRIHIRDLKVPDTVKITANQDDIVVSVTPPRTAQELEELEEAPTEAAEPEVEEKGKVEEEEKAPAAEEEKKEEPKEENA